MTNPLSFPRRLGAVALAGLLAACGGGSEPVAGTTATPASTAVAQGASGTITGFGSVIVDGVTYDDSAATIKVETDAAQPASGTTGDLKLGMQVELVADAAGRASSVTVGSAVLGRIASMASDGFTVAGQIVKVSTDPAAPTVWDGVSGLAGLVVGDIVEVHGRRDADGAIVATRVERKDPASAVAVRVVGTVADVDATARTFSVGGLRVRWSDTTRLLPTGATIQNGQQVAVYSTQPVSGGQLDARSIVVRRATWNTGDGLRVGGPIRELDFAAKTFRLDSLRVDASTATFDKGTASDLANGRRVRVNGSFVDGTLKASTVRFVRDQGDAAVELTGTVSDFAGAASFKVRGVPIDASAASVVFRNGTAANLGNGVLVKIEGAVDGNLVKPVSVEFVESREGQARWLVGPVSAYDAATGRFRLGNLDARLTDATTFRNVDGSTATRADFSNGDLVQVRGSLAAGVLVVAEVVFRPGASVVVNGVEGGAYDVEVNAGRFRLNGTAVQVGPTTVVEGSLANLRNGTQVEVWGTVVAGVVVASRLEIRTPDADGARVRGTVTDYLSAADFRVAGQRVDASAASFQPSGSSASDLANGKAVEARGTVVDGVLKATRVVFR